MFMDFRERRRGRERERDTDMRETHQSAASGMCPTRD